MPSWLKRKCDPNQRAGQVSVWQSNQAHHFDVVDISFASVIYTNLYTLTGWIGAVGNTQELAVSYLKILIPTMPILLIGIVVSAALRSHGAARLSMMVTLIAGIVNAVLDPIFIFALDMGLDGAAWASVAARVSVALTAIYFIVTRYGGFAGFSMATILRDLRPIAAIQEYGDLDAGIQAAPR